jgi:hypothetical protein
MESFTEIIYSKTNDAQAQGSGITYARRYGLQSFVCVGADDDDGNKASTPQPTIDVPRLETRLNACNTLEELATTYKSFTPAEQKATIELKDKLKTQLK